MKELLTEWRKFLKENKSFSFSVIEDELDGGPMVRIDGIDLSFQDMLSQLNGQVVDFNDGDEPEEFNFSDMDGAEDAEDAELFMIRNGVAHHYVKAWAHMNGYGVKQTGGFHDS